MTQAPAIANLVAAMEDSTTKVAMSLEILATLATERNVLPPNLSTETLRTVTANVERMSAAVGLLVDAMNAALLDEGSPR